jgi:carbohydrate binding protein with CBM6 domain
MVFGQVRTWAMCVWLALAAASAAAAASATPFGGTAVVLPGTIEAENFDEGGQSVGFYDNTSGNYGGAYRQTDVDIEATADAGGGYDVGWTAAGEWLQYTVNVSATGTYALDLRVANPFGGGTVRVDVDGHDVTGPMTVPNTGGWQTWTTMHKDGLALSAGLHTVRLVFIAAGDSIANVNWLKFTLTAAASGSAKASSKTAPATPTVGAPANGATGVAATSALTWTASGATSYSVKFGTTNSPAVVASGLTTATYAPASMANNTTYYWQIVAKNARGSTTGPIWSFTTTVAAPGQPIAGAPFPGASNVAPGTVLTWSASGATSYDVKFGPSNPPAAAATGQTIASYTPASMANNTTYYWQIVAKNAGGSTGGPVWTFTTAGSATSGSGSPLAYNAITDRTARSKPALPNVGAAGSQFADPTFGSTMMRVTDGTTRPGALNRSYRVSSNAHVSVWNANTTAFYVISNDGTVIPYQFDPATMTASRFQASGSGDGGMTLGFYVEPHFSLIDPNLIYGAGGYNARSIMTYDFRTGTYATILDLDTVVSGLANTYVGTVITGGTTSETLLTFFGGPGQDSHYYLLLAPLNNLGARKVINTVNSTINGVSTNVPLNFHIHAASIDRSGRYVFIYPTSGDLAAPRSAAQVFLWDTVTDLFTPLPASALSGGHDAAGFGTWFNQDCCTASTWDAMQWQFRYLDNPTHTTDMIPQVLTPQEIYAADHSSWSNARPDALVPVMSSTYRAGAGLTAPLRAWDDEIIGIDVNGGLGGGPVYRFAHHRSDVRSDSDPSSLYFWYEPIANVSPDGRWIVFTTNWEKTLGKDAAEGTFRQDVFMVHLTPQ